MNIMPLEKNMRRMKALALAFRYPSLVREGLKKTIDVFYYKGMLKKSTIEEKSLDQIMHLHREELPQEVQLREVWLLNFNVRSGNVSHFELLSLVSIIAVQQPRILLEVGTFDGNTTLQMALNAPECAIVHTLDLPPEIPSLIQPILDVDLPFVWDTEKRQRKYQKTPYEKKIVQHFGDSAAYDFNIFSQKGRVDFAFIDGGHSYECVRSDTEKTMQVLSDNAVVVWHDFTPNFTGVFRYLNELSATYPLVHITGTNLVYYKKHE